MIFLTKWEGISHFGWMKGNFFPFFFGSLWLWHSFFWRTNRHYCLLEQQKMSDFWGFLFLEILSSVNPVPFTSPKRKNQNQNFNLCFLNSLWFSNRFDSFSQWILYASALFLFITVVCTALCCLFDHIFSAKKKKSFKGA